MTPKKRGLLIAFMSAIFLGLYPPAAKMTYASGANVMFMILATTSARAFSLIVFCLFKGNTLLPKSGNRWPIISGGFFQAVSVFGIIGSLAYIPGPVTITIVFTHTIMLMFFMAYRER